MIEYQFTKQGEFSNEDFVSKINKAFEKISKKYNLEKDDFKQIRHSRNQGYIVNGQNYIGEYLTFEIKRNEETISHLDCFFAVNNGYIEIFSVPV